MNAAPAVKRNFARASAARKPMTSDTPPRPMTMMTLFLTMSQKYGRVDRVVEVRERRRRREELRRVAEDFGPSLNAVADHPVDREDHHAKTSSPSEVERDAAQRRARRAPRPAPCGGARRSSRLPDPDHLADVDERGDEHEQTITTAIAAPKPYSLSRTPRRTSRCSSASSPRRARCPRRSQTWLKTWKSQMIERLVRITKIGIRSGKVMSRKTCQRPAPSISAASTSSPEPGSGPRRS